MSELKSEKYVNSLPPTLEANTLYYVKNGVGFDLYLTNNLSTIIAYSLNSIKQTDIDNSISSYDDTLKGGAVQFKDRISTISNFASPNVGGIISNYYYDNNPHGGVSTTIGAANRIDLFPYYTSQTFSINRIGCAVSTAIAGSLFKIVIYSTGANSFANQKLYESADISGATIGYAFTNISFTFQSGTQYWLGVRHSSTCTLRSVIVASCFNLGLGTNGAATTQATILRRTLTYATEAPAFWNFVNTDLVSNVSATSIRFRAV